MKQQRHFTSSLDNDLKRLKKWLKTIQLSSPTNEGKSDDHQSARHKPVKTVGLFHAANAIAQLPIMARRLKNKFWRHENDQRNANFASYV